jgi:hypothetical protein
MSQLILAHGIRVINLVTQNDKGDFAQLLHGKQSIKLGLGLDETLVILGIDEEDDTGDFWEVILPETTGWVDASSAPRHEHEQEMA